MTDEAILEGQRRLWALGDYGAVARHLWPISVDLVAAAGITGGQRVLDIAVGDGNTTISAVRAGAEVVGIDIAPAQLALARARLAGEGVVAELHEANAEVLPFDDGSFDAVISSMGVIFAPDQPAAAGEMARVCRPGGTVALTAWSGGGWSQQLWERAAHLMPEPPPGAPRSDAWGEADKALGLLADAGIDARAEPREFFWEFPSIAEAATFFRTSTGPFIAVFSFAEAGGFADELHEILLAAMGESNAATDGTCRVPAPYLVVVGTNGDAEAARETRPR